MYSRFIAWASKAGSNLSCTFTLKQSVNLVTLMKVIFPLAPGGGPS